MGEWCPRWRPWIKHRATLTYDPASPHQSLFVRWLGRFGATGLAIKAAPGALRYACPAEGVDELPASAAAAMALHHTHFLGALAGAALLLIVLPTGLAAAPFIARCGRAN